MICSYGPEFLSAARRLIERRGTVWECRISALGPTVALELNCVAWLPRKTAHPVRELYKLLTALIGQNEHYYTVVAQRFPKLVEAVCVYASRFAVGAISDMPQLCSSRLRS